MQKTKPAVSVIIPTLQEEAYIEKILSNLRKIQSPIEIIVVDGGSSDKTVQKAKRFANKVYPLKKRGIACGRNYGAKHANGDILIFLDTDVAFPLDFVEKTRKAFENPAVVGATCNIMPNRFQLGTVAFFIFYNRLLRVTNRVKPHSRGEFFAVRKTAFTRAKGFDESLPVLEDHEFAHRLSKIGKFAFISDLTVYESSRRFRKLGFLRVFSSWLVDYMYFMLRGKPLSKMWRPVR